MPHSHSLPFLSTWASKTHLQRKLFVSVSPSTQTTVASIQIYVHVCHALCLSVFLYVLQLCRKCEPKKKKNKVLCSFIKVYQESHRLSSGDTVRRQTKCGCLDDQTEKKSFFSGHVLFAVCHKHGGVSALGCVCNTKPLCTKLCFSIFRSYHLSVIVFYLFLFSGHHTTVHVLHLTEK